jgi:precorrin-4 methylase
MTEGEHSILLKVNKGEKMSNFLTKKISQFLFLGVEDIRQVKKKSMCIFPEKIYS